MLIYNKHWKKWKEGGFAMRHRRLKRLVTLFLLLISLIIFSTSAYAYEVSQTVQPLNQDTPDYCAPATAKMIIDQIWSYFASKTQTEHYNYMHPLNLENWGAGVDPRGVMYGMARHTPTGYYYCNWNYKFIGGAIQGIAYNIQRWNHPVAVLANNGLHWICVNGARSDKSVYSYFSTATVAEFRVTDPTKAPPGYENTIPKNKWMSVERFKDKYLTRVSVNSNKWDTWFVSVEKNQDSANNKTYKYDKNEFSKYN